MRFSKIGKTQLALVVYRAGLLTSRGPGELESCCARMSLMSCRVSDTVKISCDSAAMLPLSISRPTKLYTLSLHVAIATTALHIHTPFSPPVCHTVANLLANLLCLGTALVPNFDDLVDFHSLTHTMVSLQQNREHTISYKFAFCCLQLERPLHLLQQTRFGDQM